MKKYLVSFVLLSSMCGYAAQVDIMRYGSPTNYPTNLLDLRSWFDNQRLKTNVGGIFASDVAPPLQQLEEHRYTNWLWLDRGFQPPVLKQWTGTNPTAQWYSSNWSSIFSTNLYLANNAVKSNHIATGQIYPHHIVTNAISSYHIQPLAITSSKLANDAVGSAQIANNAVTTTEILDKAVTIGKIEEPYQSMLVSLLNTLSNLYTPVGSIKMYGGTNAPSGWLLCDGTYLNAVSSPQYTNLYAVIGTTYGGNAITNFYLPNFMGVMPMGAGSNAWQVLSSTTTVVASAIYNITNGARTILSYRYIDNALSPTGSVIMQNPTLGVNFIIKY